MLSVRQPVLRNTSLAAAHAARAWRPSFRRPAAVMNARGSDEERAARKAAKKEAKAAARAKREGSVVAGQKECDLCNSMKDLLIRCQIDQTKKWFMVCGKCWKGVSGGEVDGNDAHPHYKYGGIWKNHAAATTVLSAKQPKSAK
mmetsp:Transcript_24894/g.73615  ORF Transcript_24894/g.73615 Transcript_24894/m.73615 type:complete len:144 (-) Transcript_24894:272-703(-)